MHGKGRIALVVPELSSAGGVRTVAEFIIRVLGKSAYGEPELISLATRAEDEESVRIISPGSWKRGYRIETKEWNGRSYRHVGAIGSEFELMRYWPRKRLTDLLNEFDLVQVVGGGPAWCYVARDVKVPVCVFAATRVKNERVTMQKGKKGWRKYWSQFTTYTTSQTERVALGCASRVFAESQYTHDLLKPVVRSGRLLLGVPGVDTNVFYPGEYRHDGPILAVARFGDPRKNLPLLLKSYRLLRNKSGKIPRLLLVGMGSPDKSEMALMEELDIRAHVEIARNVSLAELSELYRTASVFVLSSDEEGLGMVILEAMASGVPVIATRCGGPEMVVADGISGFLVPVGDAEEMANKLGEMISKPALCRTMGRAGREMVERRFSDEVAGKVYLSQYERLIGG